MTDQEKLWWEEEKKRLEYSARWLSMHHTYSMLVWDACAYAGPTKETKLEERRPMEELSNYIHKRFDDLRDLHAAPEPYAMAKERLLRAFGALADTRSKFSFDESDPDRCPVCHGKLMTVFNEPMVCEHCMQPVLDALDDLVRASTTEWTPEQLRKLAGSYIDV
jgi:hypothetical protein